MPSFPFKMRTSLLHHEHNQILAVDGLLAKMDEQVELQNQEQELDEAAAGVDASNSNDDGGDAMNAGEPSHEGIEVEDYWNVEVGTLVEHQTGILVVKNSAIVLSEPSADEGVEDEWEKSSESSNDANSASKRQSESKSKSTNTSSKSASKSTNTSSKSTSKSTNNSSKSASKSKSTNTASKSKSTNTSTKSKKAPKMSDEEAEMSEVDDTDSDSGPSRKPTTRGAKPMGKYVFDDNDVFDDDDDEAPARKRPRRG